MRKVSFAAALAAQVVFGLGTMDVIRTFEFALPHDGDRAGWDFPMLLLYFSGTHRVWLYGLGGLLLVLQVRAFRAGVSDSAVVRWMGVVVLLLVGLFANAVLVAMWETLS